MNIRWLTALAVVVAGFAGEHSSGAGQDSRHAKADEMVLRKADGTTVSVPTNGPLADERALALARAISDVDAARQAKDAFAGIGDASLRKTMNELATALRDDALDQLDLTYRVARRTSAGLDSRLLSPGFDSMRKLAELVSRPPVRQYVSTQITGRVEGMSIRFMSTPDFNSGSKEWQTYTLGQPMKLGVYEFRLVQPGGGEPLCQKVEIMRDPMIATLDPLGCQ